MAKPGENAPTSEQFQVLSQADWDGPLSMLNLLKFRNQAEYAEGEHEPSTGIEAYRRYGAVAGPFVAAVGGKPLFIGDAKFVIIGDEAEDWDEVLIVQYPTKQAFFDMINNAAYQATTVHRSAALERSALIAMKAAD